MKHSIWDILSTIFTTAGLVMASAFLIIYNNPTSGLNPFPPPTKAATVHVPSLTPSSIALPAVWTPLPETPIADVGPLVESSNTPVVIITPKPEVTKGTAYPEQKSAAGLLSTRNPYEPTGENDDIQQPLTITAPIGVFHNVWQNIQALPSFSWTTSLSTQEVDHFLLFYGKKQNGRMTVKVTNMHYTHMVEPSGIYYLKVVAIAKDGTMIGAPSVFIFKYDNTPPTRPTNFTTTSNSDTDIPYFTWTESTDAHSGMIGGLAGYSIYQGTIKKCGKPVAFTTATNWTPVTPVTKGATMYFCVRAMDAIGNISDWVGPVTYTYSN